MKPKGYLVFHLNLAFSSIDEGEWKKVIKSCYHPLLDLAEKTGICIGIELTGWTLKKIEKVDKTWIKRFKKLINVGKCELIGSGYCQIIAPLVPYKINTWNQKIGIRYYKSILNCKPKIALVNEMAFSTSLVDLYKKFGYRAFIMDRDNIKLALNSSELKSKILPTHAKGINGSVIPVLWSDSILFQKMQHFAHGEISIKSYLSYVKNRIDEGELILPFYSNDAEVFDYRPGRFKEERPTHLEGEWKRIKRLIESIILNTGIKFISPTEALEKNNKKKVISKLTNSSNPIPVKKQGKYNITRWAVTGRNDLWINTMCHRIQEYFNKSKNNNINDWQELCELWASDFRTHITSKRWNKAKTRLNTLLKRHGIKNSFGNEYKASKKQVSLKTAIGHYGAAKISMDKEGIILNISTKKIKMELNLRRGLAIQNLAFLSHKMKPCIGTLPHGYFSSISLGADYYSGGTTVELPVLRRRITDLEKVEPKFLIKNNGDIEIQAEIKTQFGRIIKLINFSTTHEKISLSYDFQKWDKIIGSIRLGVITLLNQFTSKNTKLLCSNGGKNNELFNFNEEFNHAKPASSLVSSSMGLGATSGKIKILNNKKTINLQWDPGKCAVMPMLHNSSHNNKVLSRVIFSMKEVDDTLKYSSNIGAFSLTIST